VASHYAEVVERAQALFSGGVLRLYGGRDVIGTEIGGAFKNIIALMSGASHGLGFGDNTKALIVTRGLAEMTRYGTALGAEAATFSGLAGIGDLMATCSSPLSRNFRTGVRLAVYEQSRALNLDLPMVEAVYQACFEGQKVRELLARLMDRPTGPEQTGREASR
jgi:glycerol-3-phosphate dehydrogenase (NAD(P)+)